MTTPRWEAGKLYPPGSLVQPVSSAASTVTTIPNPGFESGATGWSFSGGGAYSASGGFSGPACARITGSNGSVFLTAGIAVTPGQSITASCMGSMPAGSAGTSFDCKLVWYDSSDVLISTTEGTELRRSEGSGWRKSTTTGVAPPGAAFVRIGADGNVAVGGDIYIDDFSWNYLPSSTPGGLIYKAVQAEVGASGSSEPTWPTVLGNTVVDNEVTWEAVQANQVVWVATPLMKSGPTEPSWPTEVGSSVIDNTIRWEAISRRVTDENCPNTEAVVIMASKVFAGDEDIVRFSATANPLDWTSEQDAGYLPTGLQQANANSVAVLAPYRANLAVFNAACFQAWQADPDPAVMAILDQMDGIGSTWPRAAVAVGDELFFLSALGVRTVSISGGNESLTAGDVGMPVDPLVQEQVALLEAEGGGDALATYYPALGQYWLGFAPLPEPGIVITAWGGGDFSGDGSGSGLIFNITEDFNASLSAASTVQIMGYYTPTYMDGAEYRNDYPTFAISPTDFDSSASTYNEFASPVDMELSGSIWIDGGLLLSEDVNINEVYVFALLVDGTDTVYAVGYVNAGS